MDIYAHKDLALLRWLKISRIHKICIALYKEAAEEQHRLKEIRYGFTFFLVFGSHSGSRKGGGNAKYRFRRRWESVALTTGLQNS